MLGCLIRQLPPTTQPEASVHTPAVAPHKHARGEQRARLRAFFALLQSRAASSACLTAVTEAHRQRQHGQQSLRYSRRRRCEAPECPAPTEIWPARKEVPKGPAYGQKGGGQKGHLSVMVPSVYDCQPCVANRDHQASFRQASETDEHV